MPAPAGARGIRLLAVLAILTFVAAALLGRTPPTLAQVAAIGDAFRGDIVNIFWQYRVPRVLLGAIAGAGLALGGVVFQALFRNPLAEPYTLGLASGAALGAAIGHLLRIAPGSAAGWSTGTFALAGATLAMLLVFLMSRLRGGHDVPRLLLAGVCISYLAASGILLAHLLADRAITNQIVRWTVGSLDALGWGPPVRLSLAFAPVACLALCFHRAFDLLAMGDSLAASRGVPVARVFWIGFFAIGLLTSVIVAECGPIGFVGLIVPHLARRIVGGRTLPLLAGASLLGAAFLSLCDGLARTVSPFDLPVGLFTNILGAAFFFTLLASRGGR
jgi:iron complex transport system permease protein